MKNSKVFLLLIMGLFLIGYPIDETLAQSKKEQRSRKGKKKNVAKVNNRAASNRTVTEIRIAHQNNRNRSTSTGRTRSVKTVSNQSKVIAYRGINYRYNNGIYYRPTGNNFVVIRPPLGIGVAFLPPSRLLFKYNGRPYYYYDGVYYNQVRPNYYEVVAPPIKARISQLPPYSEDVWIDGQQYYVSEGVFYKVVQDGAGRLVYEVVGYDI